MEYDYSDDDDLRKSHLNVKKGGINLPKIQVGNNTKELNMSADNVIVDEKLDENKPKMQITN